MMKSWVRDLDVRERKTMFACFAGWALDAMDVQIYSFVIPTLLVVWHLTKAQAGVIGTAALVVSALGGVISGALCDRFGRVRVLQFTIVFYAVFTGLCGFAQNFQQLIVLRACEGFGFGGEWAAGSVLICEVIRDKFRGRAGGIVQGGWAVGWGCAAIIYTIVFSIVPEAMAWRVMFWIGLLPALLVVYLRRHIQEPEIFQKKVETRKEPVGSHFLTLFKPPYLFTTVFVSLMITGAQGATYILNIWVPTYLRVERGMSVVNTGGIMFITIAGAWIGYTLGGYSADYLGRKATLLIFGILSVVMVCAYTMLPLTKSQLLPVGFVMGIIAYGIFSPMGPYLSEMFPTKIRGTGQGFCYSFGRGIGAFFPALIGIYSMKWRLGIAIPLFFGIATAIMIAALVMLPETKGRELATAFGEETGEQAQAATRG
jgi:MFS family permease